MTENEPVKVVRLGSLQVCHREVDKACAVTPLPKVVNTLVVDGRYRAAIQAFRS
ncbi:hypothetical protein ACFQU2_18310 [Siccirubricoccus deserti]